MVKIRLAIVFIILLSAIVYHNSLHNPFIFDDIRSIVQDPTIKKLDNIGTILIREDRPLTFLTFVLNYYLGKLNTFGYHLFNIVLHTLTAVLIFFLVKKMLLIIYDKSSTFFPFLVSLLFVVHPANTEVVTYIYNRSASLAALFYILSILYFIKAVEGNKISYSISLFAFILSFLSKQTAITLPIILLIFDYIFLSNFELKRVFKKKTYHIPFWIISIIFTVYYSYFVGVGITETESIWREIWPGFSYYITQPWLVMKYLELLLVPIGLCIDHKVEPITTIFKFKAIMSFLFIVLTIIFTFRLYIHKTNISKLILFSILWFFVTLIPTSTFFVHIGERHLYLPGIGFYLIIVTLYFLVFLKADLNTKHSSISYSFIIIPIFLLGILTVKRNILYKDPVLIWQDVISKYPNSTRGYNNLGNTYCTKGEYDKAIFTFAEAIKINPNYDKLYSNRASCYFLKKEYGKAISDYNEAIRINPLFAMAYSNRGLTYFIKGEYDKAWEDVYKTQYLDNKINIKYLDELRKVSRK